MKYEGFTGQARGEGHLRDLIVNLSADGFRIISVIDTHAPRYEGQTFLVVAQKNVDAQIHVSGDDRYERQPRFAPKPRLPHDRDPSKNP